MKELIDKAEEAVQDEANKPFDKELSNLIRANFTVKNRRQIQFIIEYIKNGGNMTQAYLKVYGKQVNPHSACVLGANILRKVDIGFILDYMGHSLDQIKLAMDKLLQDDPANYMKYQTALRKWEGAKVEVNVNIDSAKKKLEELLKDE